MSVSVEFYGGPWDGVVMEVADDHPHEIELSMLNTGNLATMPEGRTVEVMRGIYVRDKHTRFGDPWRYNWKGSQ